MARVRFVVFGRVQGVAFRAHACDAATECAVVGFVRNRSDGAVEGEAEGEDQALTQFVAWLHRGPSWARVDRVESEPVADLQNEGAFEIRR